MDMEIKRLDHLGVVAGVIKDLKLIELIDHRLQKDENDQEMITPGEAITGMILNGLGFSDKPLSLTPQFFKTKALETLFRTGVTADHFNRHKLGKVLDSAHAYGCEQLFFELSSQSCAQEKIDMRFNSEDTTTFSLTGEYTEDSDEHTIKITHGYSKDDRPDLKQVVHELLVSQDAGVPLMMKSWDGNASDNKIFKERAEMLIENFKASKMPRYLIADSKLYFENNTTSLRQLNFITRIPGTIGEENKIISDTVQENIWVKLDDQNKFMVKNVTHYGMEQRWLVVYSDKCRERAKKTLEKAEKKEFSVIEKKVWHLSNKPFDCANDAEKAIDELIKKCHFHKISKKTVNEKKVYAEAGRPKKGSEPTTIQYFVTASMIKDEAAINKKLDEKSCYVIGTNIIDSNELSEIEVISAYKRQNISIENTGFRFLKDPIFFTSSLFLKKPSRIMGLLMVMTLALLVYSIAQRRLRNALEKQNQTLPNQINQPTKTPTMRWIFQLMEGIDVVQVNIEGTVRMLVHGINEIKRKIILLMGKTIMNIYGLQENLNSEVGGSSM
jgi:transposase